MELLTDMMERFASIESRVVTLVETLGQQAIEQSLGEADRDLREAGVSVAQLAGSVKEAAESLNEILVEFRAVVQVIQQADPARVAAAVAEVQEFIAGQHAETQAALQTLANESAQRHTETQAALVTSDEFIARQHAETQASLAAAEEAGARRHGEIQAAQQTLAADSAQRHSEIQAGMATSEEESVRRHGETHAVLSRQSADTGRGLSRLWGLAWGIMIAQAVGLALLAYMAFIK